MADPMLTGRIARNLAVVEERIARACEKAGRDRGEVQLLCVTKQRPDDALRALHALGYRAFGENRAQEVRDRVSLFPPDIEWHFIGALQTNKVKYLAGRIAVVHSVDRVELAEALDRLWSQHPALPPLRVLLQFNIAGEVQKHGADETAALELLAAVGRLPRLRVEGLMAMAPYGDDAEISRPVFRALRLLRDRLTAETGLPLTTLSMGMTGDYEVAIEEGSTLVRVGTALFE